MLRRQDGASGDRLQLLRGGAPTNDDGGDVTGHDDRGDAQIGSANEQSVRMIPSPVAVLVDADVAELRRSEQMLEQAG
ncbi:MAG: hypothetical protein ACREMY_04580, partial [bacterium]